MEEYYDKPGVFLNDLIEDEGEEFFYEEYQFLQGVLKDLSIHLRGGNESQIEFIGAHPISLSKLQYLYIKKNQNDWLLCEKTDGVRYLMIMLNNGHVFLTGRNVGGLVSAARKFQLFRINTNLPNEFVKQGQFSIVQMFDGELIVDKYPNNNERLNYLIFDTLIHNSKRVVDFNYFDRLRCAQEHLELCKTLKAITGKCQLDLEQLKYFPQIKCMLKDFFQIHQLKYILNHYIPILPHHNDGLIFTQNSLPYRSGTNRGISKWKPPEKNTIDFLICPNDKIEISNPNVGLLELYVLFQENNQKYFLLFDLIQVDREQLQEVQKEMDLLFDRLEKAGQIQAVQGVVAECRLEKLANKVENIAKIFNPEIWGKDPNNIEKFFMDVILKHIKFGNNCMAQMEMLKDVREQIHLKYGFKTTWKIEKYRTDKTSPNSIKVAQNLLEIINENLNQQDLLELLDKQQ